MTRYCLLLLVLLAACGPSRKQDSVKYESLWPVVPTGYASGYDVYVHGTWSPAEAYCLLLSARSHIDTWQYTQGFTAWKRGVIYIHGPGVSVLRDETRQAVSFFASGNKTNDRIEIVVDPGRDLPGLTVCIDQHQDPLSEGYDPWYQQQGRWAFVRVLDQISVANAAALHAAVGCP